jgi:hypothetical protein
MAAAKSGALLAVSSYRSRSLREMIRGRLDVRLAATQPQSARVHVVRRPSMPWKRIAAIAAVVLVSGVFLAGYLPQRRLRTVAEQEASALREQLAAAEARVRMGRLLGQILTVREVVVRQNYGQAQDLSSEFFDSVRKEATTTPLTEFRSVLNEVLSRRDSITASLAKADPAILEVLRTIEAQMRRALGYPLPQEPSAK